MEAALCEVCGEGVVVAEAAVAGGAVGVRVRPADVGAEGEAGGEGEGAGVAGGLGGHVLIFGGENRRMLSLAGGGGLMYVLVLEAGGWWKGDLVGGRGGNVLCAG